MCITQQDDDEHFYISLIELVKQFKNGNEQQFDGKYDFELMKAEFIYCVQKFINEQLLESDLENEN